MRNHLETEEKLAAYIEGDLSEEERRIIEEQLEESEEMRESLSDLKKTVRYLRNLEEVEPPSRFTQRIMSRIREEAAEQNKGIFEKLLGLLSAKPLVQAFAAVFLVFLSFVLYVAYKPEPDRVRSTGSGISKGEQTDAAWGDINIILGADDIEGAGSEVQAAVCELGGVVLGKQFFRDKEVLLVRFDSRRIEELYQRLKPIGEVKEKGDLSAFRGNVKIKVEIVKE